MARHISTVGLRRFWRLVSFKTFLKETSQRVKPKVKQPSTGEAKYVIPAASQYRDAIPESRRPKHPTTGSEVFRCEEEECEEVHICTHRSKISTQTSISPLVMLIQSSFHHP